MAKVEKIGEVAKLRVILLQNNILSFERVHMFASQAVEHRTIVVIATIDRLCMFFVITNLDHINHYNHYLWRCIPWPYHRYTMTMYHVSEC